MDTAQLLKIKTEYKITLACLSGAQMGLNQEKNWRSKISWHTPFKETSYVLFEYLKGPSNEILDPHFFT